jgi:hypothetical protein
LYNIFKAFPFIYCNLYKVTAGITCPTEEYKKNRSAQKDAGKKGGLVLFGTMKMTKNQN